MNIGAFRDSNNDISMGRIISFIGTILGGEIIQIGLYLSIWEVLNKSTILQGVSIIVLGAGIFTGGALFKWASLKEESKEIIGGDK
jgi:hypothetical protein